jgi:hypothetical protein
MAASNNMWQAVHALAIIIEADFPSRTQLRDLAEEFAALPKQTREARTADAEYVVYTLDELFDLIRQVCVASARTGP